MATQDGGASGAQAPEQPRRRRRKWPWVLGILGALFVVVAGAAGWLAYTGVQAKRGLDTAADALTGAQSSLLGGDVTEAQAAVQQASALTAEARTITSDPVWRVAGAVPFIGATPRSVTLATDAADQVVSQALPQFVAAAATLDIDTIKSPEGRIDLARFAPAGAQLTAAEDSLLQAQATLDELPSGGVPGFVQNGTSQLSAEVEEALAISQVAGSLLEVLPGMLGQNGAESYFVAFQSPVEIRGTGGFLGSYGLLTVVDGDLVDRQVESNNTLREFPAPVVDLGADYLELYGTDVRGWVNMNVSPNFPYAGVQWGRAMELQFNERVAGVLGVDITALRYLIQATGPVTAPDGKVLTADNVVQYLGNDIYFEFADDNAAREEYQGQIAVDLIDRVISLDGGVGPLIDALTASVSGGHLQMWATDPQVQEVISATPLAGETPTEPGPFVELVLNNGAGNKMDYYLAREVTYTGGQCRAESRDSTVAVTLTNTVPTDQPLPRYITIRSDDDAPEVEDRSNRTLVYVHLPVDSGVTEVRIDGQPTTFAFGRELDRPVAYGAVDLPPGQPVTIELDVTEPISDADPVVPVQPMVIPQQTTVEWSGC